MIRAILSVFLVYFVSFLPSCAQNGTESIHVPKARAHRESDLRNINNDSLSISSIADSVNISSDSVDFNQTNATKFVESINIISDDSINRLVFSVDSSLQLNKKIDLNVKRIPDAKKAMWLAIAFPGGGQIYNRKFWKLPLVYGGFLGCVYALRWNNTMYSDYSNAYIDIMDDDPNTKSYETFLPEHYDVSANAERLKDLFKRKKDYYRRYRDLSIFCMIGVYVLSVIDAYVDAEMSDFNLSKDLSMKVKPTIINSRDNLASRASLAPSSYGVQCSLAF